MSSKNINSIISKIQQKNTATVITVGNYKGGAG
ncbi:ParA family protein, partial [Listeria monocytogenes serotype 3a]|nr:ParA family protein [Listeria monocytogenes serotype 3a]